MESKNKENLENIKKCEYSGSVYSALEVLETDIARIHEDIGKLIDELCHISCVSIISTFLASVLVCLFMLYHINEFKKSLDSYNSNTQSILNEINSRVKIIQKKASR